MRRVAIALGTALLAGRLAAQPPTPPAMPPSTPSAGDSIDPSRFGRAVDAATPAAVAQSGGKLTANYAIPEMPASSVLGDAPALVTRPATPKGFASSLLDGIDVGGRVRQGLAVETSLGMFRPFRVPLSTYQTSRRARVWTNVLVSLATVRVAGDTQSTDVAWGVRAPLYDGGDPLARPAYTRRLGAAMLTCAPAAPPLQVPRTAGRTAEQIRAADDSAVAANALLAEQSRAQQLACLEGVATETGKAAADSLWNAARLVVAYAGSTRLPQSVFRNRRRVDDRVWLVGALPVSALTGPLPIARSSQLIGYADYVRHHAVDTLPSSNGVSYGARLNVGSASLDGFGEVLGAWRDNPPKGARATTAAFSGGVEFLAAPGVWISTGVGRRYSDAGRVNKTVVLANIRWGIANTPFLTPGRDGQP